MKVKVRDVTIGEGMPKICVSLMGHTLSIIQEEIEHLKTTPIDIVEWRIDFYEYFDQEEKMIEMLKIIRKNIGNMPLLVTFRTLQEGGNREISIKDYINLYKTIIQTKLVDLIDIQLFLGDAVVKELVAFAHDYNVKVLTSNHDFEKTPPKEEIINRLRKMQDLGADIPKIAVMPQNADDVLTLLSATYEMKTKYATRPIITMSMSKIGLISRLTGDVFGSAVTFGANLTASAPGQISGDLLKQTLEVLQVK